MPSTTKTRRKRTKRLTKNQLLTILNDYTMIRACNDGYERARAAGKTPSAMFHGVCMGDRRWFFQSLVNHSNVKDSDAVTVLGLRKVLFSLRKDLIAELTPIVQSILRRFDRAYPSATDSDIRRLLVSTLDALRFPDDMPGEFFLDQYAVIGASWNDSRAPWVDSLAYFLRHVLYILTMGYVDDFKRNSTVLDTLHNMHCRFFPTGSFSVRFADGTPLYSQNRQDRLNSMLMDIASRVPWTRYERLLRKMFPKV